MNLMQASNQWATRPADERFVSLQDLHSHCVAARENSRARVISTRMITCAPVEDNPRGLVVQGQNGSAALTHWSFGQLCARAGFPAGPLRELPGDLTADVLNYKLRQRQVEDIGVLLHKNGGAPELRAVTGPNYGRVWNSTITHALVDRFGDGVTGAWKVPGEFGKDVSVTKDNTTLYASDRDMFVFLADEKNRIEVPSRRDGKTGSLARGFFMWNSEVGSQTFGVATFLFDYVCANRIVWGAEGYDEIRIRHTASAPDRWVEEVAPAIERYAQSSTAGITKAITDARSSRIDDVSGFLIKRFTRSQAAAIQAAHMADEQRPIETLWDASVGVTAYARGIQYQDQRVELEREAGRILDMAA